MFFLAPLAAAVASVTASELFVAGATAGVAVHQMKSKKKRK
jgi:hypothetical protein